MDGWLDRWMDIDRWEMVLPQHVIDAGLSLPPPQGDLPVRENVEAMSKCRPKRDKCCQQNPNIL